MGGHQFSFFLGRKASRTVLNSPVCVLDYQLCSSLYVITAVLYLCNGGGVICAAVNVLSKLLPGGG